MEDKGRRPEEEEGLMSLSAHSTNTAGWACPLTRHYPFTQLRRNTQHLRLGPPHLAPCVFLGLDQRKYRLATPAHLEE